MSLPRTLRRTVITALVTVATALVAVGVAPGTAPAAASANSAGTYEDTAGALTWSGDWRTMKSRSDSGGSSRYLNSSGSVSFTFTGTAVQWISRVTRSAGIADVYLDGAKVQSVDRYSSTEGYQRVAFEKTGLASGSHTLKVAWTGRGNSRSLGKNLLVDSFVVPDVSAPQSPGGLSVTSTGAGTALLTWKAPTTSDVAGYRVYTVDSGGRTVVGTTAPGTLRFSAVGLPADVAVKFAVVAVDSAGNESPLSGTASLRSGSTPVSDYRYSSCPSATVTVRTADGLMSAAAKAKPGTVIRMAPGTYGEQIDLTARGTAAQPIWVCGPRSAVIDTGTIKDNHGIMISGSSNLIVTGMTVRDALKGVTVRSSSRVTVSDLSIHTIGYEGVHLRENTTDSVVVGNRISETGRLDPFYGEGVYVGSSEANWCSLTDCLPDRSDRNALVANSISVTGSDPIEVKEGTTGGVIKDNTLNGADGMAKADAWVKVKGNSWSIVGNSGSHSTENGFRLQGSTGWGFNNVFSANRADVDADGYGFSLYEPGGDGTTRTVVSCDNVVTGADSGFTTATCVP